VFKLLDEGKDVTGAFPFPDHDIGREEEGSEAGAVLAGGVRVTAEMLPVAVAKGMEEGEADAEAWTETEAEAEAELFGTRGG